MAEQSQSKGLNWPALPWSAHRFWTAAFDQSCNRMGIVTRDEQASDQEGAEMKRRLPGILDIICTHIVLALISVQISVAFAQDTSGIMRKAEEAFNAKDYVTSRKLYKLACDSGDATACFWTAEFLRMGEGGDKDEEQARSLYESACAQGVAKSCYTAGAMHDLNLGGAGDRSQARAMFQKACDGQNTNGCKKLAFYLYSGEGGAEDKPRARALYEELCYDGNTESCSSFALMLERGEGGDQDQESARGQFELACKEGYARACAETGRVLLNGIGGPVDLIGARTYYTTACDSGVAFGCSDLGYMLNEGLGGPRNDIQARELFKKACDSDFAHGCLNLASMLDRGEGGAQDQAGARTLYGKACDAQHAEACFNLALMWEAGDGGPKDFGPVGTLLRKSCDGGYKNACTHLKNLVARLDADIERLEKEEKEARAAYEKSREAENKALEELDRTLEAAVSYSVGRPEASQTLEILFSVSCHKCIDEFDRSLSDLEKLIDTGDVRVDFTDVSHIIGSSQQGQIKEATLNATRALRCMGDNSRESEYLQRLRGFVQMLKDVVPGEDVDGNKSRRFIRWVQVKPHELNAQFNLSSTADIGGLYMTGVGLSPEDCEMEYYDELMEKVEKRARSLSLREVPLYVLDGEALEVGTKLGDIVSLLSDTSGTSRKNHNEETEVENGAEGLGRQVERIASDLYADRIEKRAVDEKVEQLESQYAAIDDKVKRLEQIAKHAPNNAEWYSNTGSYGVISLEVCYVLGCDSQRVSPMAAAVTAVAANEYATTLVSSENLSSAYRGSDRFVDKGGQEDLRAVFRIRRPDSDVYFVTSKHVSDEATYTWAGAIHEKFNRIKERLGAYPHAVGQEAKDWNRNDLFENSPPVPFHEGAYRYFQEVGLANGTQSLE